MFSSAGILNNRSLHFVSFHTHLNRFFKSRDHKKGQLYEVGICNRTPTHHAKVTSAVADLFFMCQRLKLKSSVQVAK